jgi:hypothetical protein
MDSDLLNTPPAITVHVRTVDGNLEYCICRLCRRFDDPVLRALYGTFSLEYRRFKRQSRMRRKKRRGWA